MLKGKHLIFRLKDFSLVIGEATPRRTTAALAGSAGFVIRMMELVITSSGRIRVVGQLVLKIKYCHTVFETHPEVKNRCEAILREVLQRNGVAVEAIGFDNNHVHFLINIAINYIPELVKKLKGETARKLLTEFPEVKRKYFWGSGFWNPSWYFDTGGPFKQVKDYVLNQKLTRNEREAALARQSQNQRQLIDYA